MLTALLALAALLLYAAPVALCPRVPEEGILFPCFPATFRADGALYLLYCGATMQGLFMAGLSTLQMTDRALIALRLTAIVTTVAFLMHAPFFHALHSGMMAHSEALWRLFSLTPLLLWPPAFLYLRTRRWLWRTRSGALPPEREIKRTGLWLAWAALLLTTSSASQNIHTYTAP
jgi:hypothetical protein